MMYKMLQYLIYPLILSITVSGALYLVDYYEEDKYVFIPGILSITCVIVFIILERFMPYRKSWNDSRGDFITDLIQTFFTLPFATKLAEIFLVFALYYPVSYLSELFSFVDLIQLKWGIIPCFILCLIICEFFYYWIHRWSHKNDFLWKFHSIHHGAERIYWANSGRFHLLDAFLSSFAYLIPVILLGVSEEVIVLLISFSAITGFLEHVNIDFRAGFLNYIFNTAELHRWHHSENENVSNHNYGKVLIIWDLIFGSFFKSKKKTINRVGISGEKIPVTFIKQFFYPFK